MQQEEAFDDLKKKLKARVAETEKKAEMDKDELRRELAKLKQEKATLADNLEEARVEV